MYPAKEENTNREITEAKIELVKWRAIRELIHNNELGLEIHVEMMGINLGVCTNIKLLPLVNYQIKQINKFLRGEPNEWK